MSKSQITLFIILGIVILIVFGFAFYISENTQKKRIEATVEKPIADFLKSKAINYYVTSCLDKVSKEALILIGGQGGFIHKEQGGLVNWTVPFLEYQGKNVSYQIYNDLSDEFKEKHPTVADPPEYPCYTLGPYSGLSCYTTYDNIKIEYRFGSTEGAKNITPDLCKKELTVANYPCTCSNQPHSLNCNYSIQSQLEYYVANKTKECINFSNIKGYNISKGNLTANVSFSETHVLFKIDFPIIIQVKGSEPIITVLHFSLPQQVRLKILHDLALDIINKDKDDVSFDIVKHGQDIATEKKYESIRITRDSTAYKNASIITIEDVSDEYKIDGKNYKFMFARENRAPALNYMQFTSFGDYDLYTEEDQPLSFEPEAYDPDEDNLIYYYSSLDWDAEDNPLDDDILANKLIDSSIYKNPTQDKDCIHPFSGLTEARRCATYQLTKEDVGKHILTIKPQDADPKPSYDFQTIDIFVDDKPEIDIRTGNDYNDISNDKASIEDLFKFDLSGSTDTFPPGGTLQFRLGKKAGNNIEWIYDWTNQNVLKIPKVYFTIETIKRVTSFTPPPPAQTETQTFIVEARNTGSPLSTPESKDIDIKVQECLPHRSPHASYPFHDVIWDNYGTKGEIPADDFQGDHTCCKDDGTYENPSKECYRLIDYGCLADFEPGGDYYDPGGLITDVKVSKPIPIKPPTTNDEKDVYKRTLRVRCRSYIDDKRGNICDKVYPGNYIIQYRKTCDLVGLSDPTVDEGCDNDNDKYADSSMTCSGNFKDGGGSTRSCYNYGGDCDDNNAARNPGRTENPGDGIDNNCNGIIDEGRWCSTLNQGNTQLCTKQLGVCAGSYEACTGGKWSGCNYGIDYEPNTETKCDKKDNDCDGLVDEDVTRPCGSDVGECKFGTQTCTTGTWGGCYGSTGPIQEICNNDLDEDCDGSIDEKCYGCIVGQERKCGTDVGECNSGKQTCNPNKRWGECLGSITPTDEICDNKNNNCDGTNCAHSFDLSSACQK